MVDPKCNDLYFYERFRDRITHRRRWRQRLECCSYKPRKALAGNLQKLGRRHGVDSLPFICQKELTLLTS